MNKMFLCLGGLVACIAITYCLVMYSPKSIFSKIGANEQKGIELQAVIQSLAYDMRQFRLVRKEDSLKVATLDSSLAVERAFRKQYEVRLDSLLKTRNKNVPKRLPLN